MMRDVEVSVEHEVQNPNFKDYVQQQFGKAAFIQHLGIQLEDFGPGKTLTIVESKVWAVEDGCEKLIAKMMATMALV